MEGKMKKRDLGAEIIAGLKEFRDHPESLKRYEVKPTDVKALRTKMGMTQPEFAQCMFLSVKTVQKWEQGERKPTGAATALLRVMEKEPEAVLRALHG